MNRISGAASALRETAITAAPSPSLDVVAPATSVLSHTSASATVPIHERPSVSVPTTTIVTGLMPSPSVTLTIDMEGLGSGEVTSDVPGISCTTGTCAASFTHGTIVTLTATAESDSAFIRFSGDTDCTDGVVTLETGTTCHATFSVGAAGTN